MNLPSDLLFSQTGGEAVNLVDFDFSSREELPVDGFLPSQPLCQRWDVCHHLPFHRLPMLARLRRAHLPTRHQRMLCVSQPLPQWGQLYQQHRLLPLFVLIQLLWSSLPVPTGSLFLGDLSPQGHLPSRRWRIPRLPLSARELWFIIISVVIAFVG